TTRFVPFPSDIEAGALALADIEALLQERGVIGADDHLGNTTLRSGALFLTRDDFERQTGKDHPQADLNANGSITFQPTTNTSLRLTGGFNNRVDQTYNFTRSLYATDMYYDQRQTTWRAAGTWRQYLSNSTFYEITASYNNDYFIRHPNGFSEDVRDRKSTRLNS